MGALPVGSVRMAGRGDPRGDHAEAVPVRGHRRDRGRADHLDPGIGRHRTQLGLPLLLAARCRLHRARAQPARRHAHDGGVHPLHLQPDRQQGRQRSRPGIRHHLRGRIARAPGGHAQRLSRDGPGAGRQRRLATAPERRLWLGGARLGATVLRLPARTSRRRGDVPPARTDGHDGAAHGRTDRCGPVGIPRPHRRAHLFRRDVLGRLRPSGAHRHRTGAG